jgi:hypothetical protein
MKPITIIARIKGLAEASKMLRSDKKLSSAYIQQIRRELGYDSRHHLLALGFARGLTYKQIEAKCQDQPDIDCIVRIVNDIGKTWRLYYAKGDQKTMWWKPYSRVEREDGTIKKDVEMWLAEKAPEVVPNQPSVMELIRDKLEKWL